MRIRKQASKLLGWAPVTAPFHSSSSPPPPSSTAHSWPPPPLPLPESSPGEVAAGGLRCQLNLSPWDAMESHFCTDSQEEAEETIVVGNGFGAKEEQITSVDSATVVEEGEKVGENRVKEKDTGWKKEKKTTAKKGEQTAINAASDHEKSVITMKCKKTDGKGWHCKRPAELSHSLCLYHLAQLRSYNYRDASSEDGGRHDRKKKPLAAVTEVSACGSASSNYYYYYYAFGPWRSKRRGPVDGVNGAGSNDSRKSSESADNSAMMDDDVKDDEEDEEEKEEKDGEKMNICKAEEGKKKKKRPLNRKGRKPVKARSLQSLL